MKEGIVDVDKVECGNVFIVAVELWLKYSNERYIWLTDEEM